MVRRTLAVALLLATCACSGPPGCVVGARMQVFTLYFGESIRGRADLTDAEWRRFLDDTVSVNLPDGYTVTDAQGAWRNPRTGTTVSEATKVLTVALPSGPDSVAAVNRIRAAYQERFRQQLVGLTTHPGCADF